MTRHNASPDNYVCWDGIGGVAFVLHGYVPSSLILHGPTAKSFICQDCFLRTDWGLDRRTLHLVGELLAAPKPLPWGKMDNNQNVGFS